MKKLIKKIVLGSIFFHMIGCMPSTFAMDYTVQPNDTYWKISQKYNIDFNELLKINNATENFVLNVGQKILIPDIKSINYYEVQKGDTAWIISQKFNVSLNELLKVNNLDENSILYIGQKIEIPSTKNINTIPEQPNTTIDYIDYTVKSGDDFWNLSLKYGVPYQELLNVNNATSNTILNIGDIIKIPQHNIPVTDTLGDKYGEYLDWWNAAQYVIPIGAIFEIVDFYTGKSFMAKRTYGANHADVETLTSKDTEIMKEIWGGNWSWATRPVIVKYKGRKIAASASGMPHAGNDLDPANINTDWRSGNYGPGINFDAIKGNEMNGHFDVHFLNSTTHKTGKISESHQKNIKISAGILVE
ncbi:LysM peptidoglycan-binding domain-containing protein [Tepidibacter thalassicus]|uniref:LysM repeat-containing protein n=1 Tax=Tepidibacter thalassicus DSM 15285 TaxID=1123350 RepID=A0A1M5NZG0_9FIRM|nr:LysM peptidoglycan-binding domain-containing protein [Tepidibacter thalassicus]SHG94845.1 LysM repeat-containing protein [Tepidibacter thalassicus DSM 15285]